MYIYDYFSILEYAERGGTRQMKYQTVADCVCQRFCEAREAFEVVRERDLQEWALDAAEDCGLDNFKACRGWLHTLKKKLHITSRKITTFRTSKTAAERSNLEENINAFMTTIKPILADVDPSNVTFQTIVLQTHQYCV